MQPLIRRAIARAAFLFALVPAAANGAAKALRPVR